MKKAFKAIFCGLGLTAFLSTALIGSTIAYSQDKVEFIDETKIIETGSTYKTLIRYTTTSERDLLIDILGEDYKFYAGTRVPINPGSAEIEIEIEIPDDSKVTDRVGFRSVKLVPRGAEWREKIQEDIKDIEYQSPQPVQLEEFVKSINENNIVETDSPYKITVKYHALEARDLLVELLSKNYDYYAGKRVPVEAGSGEIEVTLQVPGNRIATNINGFRSIKLVPSGSDWKNTIKEALDPIEYKINTTGSGDMDRDGIPDNEDLAPNSRYKVPLFLIHGRGTSTEPSFGIRNSIRHDTNLTSNRRTNDHGLDYTNPNHQKVTAILPPKAPYRYNIAEQLVKRSRYKINKSLFAFNFGSMDSIRAAALTFNKYIKNLKAKAAAAPESQLCANLFKTRKNLERGIISFDVLTQSMGGLVARYYIENLGKSRNVRKLITIGATHWGTALAKHASGNNPADLDQRPDSRMLHGNRGGPTDPIKYWNHGSSRYFFIGAVTGPTLSPNPSELFYRVSRSIRTHRQLDRYVRGFTAYKGATYSGTALDDNLATLLSQIGWSFKDFKNLNATPRPKHRVPYEECWIYPMKSHSNTLFSRLHGKFLHRYSLINKVIHILRK